MAEPISSPPPPKRAGPAAELALPSFPIVGIGCSAGGLGALEKLFAHVPPQSGMAFVVVQHLSPDHTSALAQLLQRSTTMPVVDVQDGVCIRPDCVYTIPPSKNMIFQNGQLHLTDRTEKPVRHQPIDSFFRSLAADQKTKAIGIILSGMGEDGVLGLQAIKDEAGLTLAQTPDSAQSDSMPRCAIAAGVVDIVDLAEALPNLILAHLRNPVLTHDHSTDTPEQCQDDLDAIINLLYDASGHDFSGYKTSTLTRRLERRVALLHLSNLAEYVLYARANPHELPLLFNELLIGVTQFFRDPDLWAQMTAVHLPKLMERHGNKGRPLRAWVPACSTGEEAYTLAIAYLEARMHMQPPSTLDIIIYATDISAIAVETARKGIYSAARVADIPQPLLQRYFVADNGGYRIGKAVRDKVVFAQQNILSDPPFTKLDVLSCRNLLIYFQPKLQKRLMPLLHYTLNPGGMLLLGSAETIGTFGLLYAAINSKLRLYRRIDCPPPLSELDFPSRTTGDKIVAAAPDSPSSPPNIGQIIDHYIQQNFAPAAVLVNGDGDILYISGHTGNYLEPAAGRFNLNIHAMAREGLRENLTGIIRKALQQDGPIHLNGLPIPVNGKTQIVNVIVQPFSQPQSLQGLVLVVFKDVAARAAKGSRNKGDVPTELSLLQDELRQTRLSQQAAHQDMCTTTVDMRDKNEELQATNEELQSTNEELTTSKDEIQSLNEELQTVNAELQPQAEELSRLKNDMMNLLNSTAIASIFLDPDLVVRRFTAHATSVMRLIPGDVGRPLAFVVSDIDTASLLADAKAVLESQIFQEKPMQTSDNRWFRVRTMPYRTTENAVDGVVITFTDITELKRLQK